MPTNLSVAIPEVARHHSNMAEPSKTGFLPLGGKNSSGKALDLF